jgi:hypothetical protein
MIEMNNLSDECLAALEQIVGGKVYSVYYDPIRRTYDVGFEKDNRLQQKEVSKELVEDVMAGRTNLDGLRKD